ncbi:MAG: hypothetical protein HY000_35770, partial [Planctomycetes bacterium]|nr:hypothetical protein [Planctomycetota bacterium]
MMRPTVEVLEARLLLTHPVPLPQIEQEPNDTPELANIIRLDTEAADHDPAAGLSGHMGGELNLECALFCLGPRQVPSDQDWFKFEAPAGQRLDLHVVGEALRGVAISLLHNGQELASDTDSSDGLSIEQGSRDGATFYVRLFVPSFDRIASDGTICGPVDRNHRLECRGHIPYLLNVHVTPGPPVEHEPNDTLEQANPISFQPPSPCVVLCVRPLDASGSTDVNGAPASSGTAGEAVSLRGPRPQDGMHGFIEGSLDNRDNPAADCAPVGCGLVRDTDFFSFMADPQRQIQVLFQGEATQAGVLPQLLDSNGAVLATAHALDRDGDGQADAAILDYFTQTAGKFFVQVGPDLNATGTSSEHYRLMVDVTPDPHHEHEPNNTL